MDPMGESYIGSYISITFFLFFFFVLLDQFSTGGAYKS